MLHGVAKMRTQERSDLDTTMTEHPDGRISFVSGPKIRVVRGENAQRLRAFWHMCHSDHDFWQIMRTLDDHGEFQT